ncbi:cytochrome c oxidase subunit CcoM [Azotobacter sp. CWF10]
MFVDEVVLAGIAVVAGAVIFAGGFGYFIWKDAQKRK